MIIEHEAAGTLLKSTENRAGGFTCRINFYLVSSLLLFFAHSSAFRFSPHADRDRFSRSSPVFPVYRPPCLLPCFFRAGGSPFHLVVCVGGYSTASARTSERANERINEHERKSSAAYTLLFRYSALYIACLFFFYRTVYTFSVPYYYVSSIDSAIAVEISILKIHTVAQFARV